MIEPRKLLKVRIDEGVIVRDPSRQFGKACPAGTRVPTTSAAYSVLVEDHHSLDGTADEYGLSRREVIACCWYETLYGDRPGDFRHWGEWAITAAMWLGGHRGHEDPGDPPVKPQRAKRTARRTLT